MASKSSTVVVQILGDADQYKREMSSVAQTTGKTEKELGKFGSAAEANKKKLTDFGKAAVAGLVLGAAVAVKQFVGESIQAFSNLEQSVGGTEAVFGDASGAIDEFAARSAEAIGLSEAEFRTATTLIGGQLKRMTGDVDLAADQSIILTEVAADLAATYGGTTKEAVDALSAAFRGEADPAERFNLNLKVSAINAKAVELGLAETTSKVDENAKAQATLALIMEQSADAQGQFAREQDTIAGRTQILTAKIEDQKAAIGQQLAPVVLDLSTAFSDMLPTLGKVVEEVASFATEASAIIGPLAAVISFMGEAEEESSFLGDSMTGLKESILNTLLPWRAFTEFSLGAEEAMVQVADSAEQVALETARGRDRADEYAAALKKTTEETEEQTATDKLLAAEADKLATKIEGYWQDQAEAAAKTDLATAAIRGNMEAMAALLDPVVNAAQKVDNLNEKQATLVELQGDSEASAADLAQAELDVALALIETQGAFDALDPKTLEQSIDTIATVLGISKEEARQLLENLGLIDGMVVNATVKISEIIRRSTFKGIEADTTRGRQHGGPVSARTPYLVGEAGPEVFVPAAAGKIVPNGSNGSPVGGTNIYLSVTSLDPQAAGRAVVEALQSWQRSNGALPITVRSA